MKASRATYISLILFTVLFLALTVFYAVWYQYHFYWHEQNQIFLLDSEWISHYFERPAWLACLSGEYLTQFYYYQYAGPAILAVIISLTVCIAYRCIKSMLPLGVAVIGAIGVGVWCIGSSFAATYTLAQTLCITGGIISFMAAKRLGYWGLIIISLSYWLFGFGVLCTVACYLLMAVGSRSLKSVICAIAAVVIALVLPLCLKSYYTLHYASALIYPQISMPTTPECGFEHTLAVENEYYFGNYDKAVSLALEKDPPNVVTAFYYYLSQAKRDSLPDYLLSYGIKDLGTLSHIDDTTPRPVINMMNDLYYELGDMTYAERAAMMRNVFSPVNRNVRMMRRLAQVNLAAGDSLAAKKYLRLLSKTHAYSDWAAHYLAPDNNLTSEAHACRRIRISDSDTIRLGDNCRTILQGLLAANPDNTMALDYLLCTDLLLKQIDTFKADYDTYCMSRNRPRLRPLYQQALMIYLAGTDAPTEEWERYIHSPNLFDRFRSYNSRRGDPAFNDTYWYYFDKTKLN